MQQYKRNTNSGAVKHLKAHCCSIATLVHTKSVKVWYKPSKRHPQGFFERLEC